MSASGQAHGGTGFGTGFAIESLWTVILAPTIGQAIATAVGTDLPTKPAVATFLVLAAGQTQIIPGRTGVFGAVTIFSIRVPGALTPFVFQGADDIDLSAIVGIVGAAVS
jgi:hypothetical protein